ncbi:MAG TPA: LLM class flavin-dependent oxidoreductase [Gemmatimonadales bacterium]|nr:LLM class flavin-dependent oxidoreductase [Gemmatimonadales bacterium]
MTAMSATQDIHPWVREWHGRVGFGLEVFPIETRDEPTRALLAAGDLAETLGFDSFWFGDHPAWGLDCWLHMAAVAVRTKRMRLGVNVACALYRHPVLTARLAADLDNLSDGRLILGLGIGWDENEFDNLGLRFPPVPERQAALEEAIAIIRGVWGDEPFSYEGAHFRTRNAQVKPAPRQQPGPPILIAGGGERVTLRQVAHLADAAQLGMFGNMSGDGTVETVGHKLAVLDRHLATAGRSSDAVLRTHFTGWLILAEDEERLDAKVRRMIPEGIEQRFSGGWDGYAVAATPEQAVAMYRSLVTAGIEYFVVTTLDASDTETIRLLAERVIPSVAS